MSLSAIILAGGQGTRMKSDIPKVLHRAAGEPLIVHVLRALAPLEAEPLAIITGHRADEVRAALGNGYLYVKQTNQLGTGHAVLQARPLLEGKAEDVLVLYGDHPLTTTSTLEQVWEAHRRERSILTFLAFYPQDPTGYARVLRDPPERGGRVRRVVEEVVASPEEKQVGEAVSGVLCFKDAWLWSNLERARPHPQKGELFLTDLISLALEDGEPVAAPHAQDEAEAQGVNTRIELAQAEAILRQRVRQRLMLGGVSMIDPPSTFIDSSVAIGRDTLIYPGTLIEGQTIIGARCRIGPQAHIRDSQLGDDCIIQASTVESSMLEGDIQVGPYSHLRPGSRIGREVHIGNYVEIKEASIGPGTHIGHFAYIGDASIGRRVNIGAGTITCNFDGVKKNRTVIEDGAFIGSDTMLVAPVTVGRGAVTGAGSVVTRDVPPGALAVGVPARLVQRNTES
ncbi:MAG: bifunctional UDP-N-acetylglucosamine diphosphorylase/glucosamine-1-phosphate N-acetyltransferase GlmU [Chloroflexi bacterium]|nr:bifunctional UDP-N-acetylglucosamine diphosphorylase/glucosamine-1-phosphate N-acetyltransferase GlmU [Chloroflexota bacterium]